MGSVCDSELAESQSGAVLASHEKVSLLELVATPHTGFCACLPPSPWGTGSGLVFPPSQWKWEVFFS